MIIEIEGKQISLPEPRPLPNASSGEEVSAYLIRLEPTGTCEDRWIVVTPASH